MWSQVSLRLCDEYPPPPDIRLRDPGCHTGALNSPWRLRAPHHPQAPLTSTCTTFLANGGVAPRIGDIMDDAVPVEGSLLS